jgi:hypothetical protein
VSRIHRRRTLDHVEWFAWVIVVALYAAVGALVLISSARILARDDDRRSPRTRADDGPYARDRGDRRR